jgi:hypothetical protein
VQLSRTRKRVAAIAAIALPLTGVGAVVLPAVTAHAAPSATRLEVCKQTSGSGSATTFNFTLDKGTAGAATFSVKPGTCVDVPGSPGIASGTHTITEAPATGWRLGFVSVSGGTKDKVVGTTATVTVPSGGDTLVTFHNVGIKGTLKVCKVAGDSSLVGSSWNYTASWGANTAQINGVIAGGVCRPLAGTNGSPLALPFGTVVHLTETLLTGTYASNITTQPAGAASNVIDGNGVTPSVDVTLNGGNTVATFTNKEVPLPNSGYLKVCKGGDVSGTFHFAIAASDGTTYSLPVVAGQCSEVQLAHAGVTSIAEVNNPLWYAPSRIFMLNGTLISSNVANGTATVLVTAGDQSSPTVLEFDNKLVTMPLEICKQITTNDLNGQTFTFRVSALPSNLAPGVWTGTVGVVATYGTTACQTIFEPLGAQVNISEQSAPSVINTSVTTVVGTGGTVLSSNPGTGASFIVGRGDNVVTFVNAATGALKVCKFGLDNSTIGRTFIISAGGATFPLVAENPFGLARSCQLIPGVPVGPVTVSETTGSNFHLAAYSINLGPLVAASAGQTSVSTSVTFGNETEVDLYNAVNTVKVELCTSASDTHVLGDSVVYQLSWSGAGVSGSTLETGTATGCSQQVTIPAVDNNNNPVQVTGTVTAGTPYGSPPLPIIIDSITPSLNAIQGSTSGIGTNSATVHFIVGPPSAPTGTGIETFDLNV